MIKVMCFESQDLFLFIYEEANKSEGICHYETVCSANGLPEKRAHGTMGQIVSHEI